jgi:YggT family protein
MREALLFLVKTLADLYLLTFLLRFILHWMGASYYNPLAQFVIRVTNPLVKPVRRAVPRAGAIDLATLLVLIVLESGATWLLLLLDGLGAPPLIFALYVAVRIANLTLWFYTIAILIYAVLSWFGDRAYSPIGVVLGELVEPVLRPARRLLPPIGGLDLSPLLVLILLQAILIALPRLPLFLR